MKRRPIDGLWNGGPWDRALSIIFLIFILVEIVQFSHNMVKASDVSGHVLWLCVVLLFVTMFGTILTFFLRGSRR